MEGQGLPQVWRWCLALPATLALCACGWLPERHGAPVPAGGSSAWQPFEFPLKRATRYTPTFLDDRPVVRADADSSVSLYRQMVRVEPGDLGQLSFSWMVPGLISGADLSRQETEDAPVRLLLAFEGDSGKLATRDRLLFDLVEGVVGEPPPYATLMYVWDNHAAVGSVINAARTSRIRKIVVDSGPAQAGQWRFHERDIAADFRKAFGEEPGALTSVALMTDSDNTRSRAHAYYGEVKLHNRPQPSP